MTTTLTNARLGSDQLTRILNHLQRARLARAALAENGLTVGELAEKAGVNPKTALRFLGLAGETNTKDPRTSTTLKLLHVLGWRLVK